jgi:hypothetical protein
MKSRDYIILFVVVSVGMFAALIAWTLIVKDQITSSTSTNPTLAAIGSLLTKT